MTAAGNLVTFADKYGPRTQIYNGIDVTMTGRMHNGLYLSGGFSAGKTTVNQCTMIDSPVPVLTSPAGVPESYWSAGQRGDCAGSNWSHPQFKMLATYPLPWWDLQASTTYQLLPGAQLLD